MMMSMRRAVPLNFRTLSLCQRRLFAWSSDTTSASTSTSTSASTSGSSGSSSRSSSRSSSDGDATNPTPTPSSSSLTLSATEDEKNGILTLSLNRPRQRNALNREMLESLDRQLQEVATNDGKNNIRVVVLQSEGAVFCAGHDLEELRKMNESERQDLFDLSCSIMQRFRQLPQPTIAAVQGLATAAGCQLAAACDLVVASPRSGFATPGASNIGLFCHTPAVELMHSNTNNIGSKRALDMLFTGRAMTAKEAMEAGLISRISGNPQKEAQKIAQQLAMQSQSALRFGKEIFRQTSSSRISAEEAYKIAGKAMVDNLQTLDAQHGIDSFLNKTKPTWNKPE